MKTYSVYHLPQFVHPNGRIGKVGCTSYDDPQKRAIEQLYTFNDFEVLEQYEDIHVASDREIQLQKEYGYPVDNVPYWQAVENRLSASSAGGIASYKNGVSELRKTIYVNQGRLMGLANKGKKKTHSRITCPHCNKEGGSNNMKRWHFDNCKLA